MTLIFAFIFGAFIVGNLDNTNTIQEKKETAQVNIEKNAKKKSAILEVKPEPKTPEPIKEEIKPEPKTPEPKQEEVQEIDNLDEQGTSWLKLALYILGPLLAIVIGKNLYNKIKNNSSPSSASNYMRREFKEEENPAQEEVQSDTTTEENPAQEEVQSDTTTDQETTEEEDNNSKNN